MMENGLKSALNQKLTNRMIDSVLAVDVDAREVEDCIRFSKRPQEIECETHSETTRQA